MKALTYLSIPLLMLFIGSSCDDLYLDPCQDCYQDKPTEGILTVELSYRTEQPGIPVKIYRGKYEDQDLILEDTVSASSVEYWVDVGSRYSVAVEYAVNGKTLLAIDGDKVSVYLDTESCDEACWRPNDGKVDCTLD